jgi:hypothetical protein
LTIGDVPLLFCSGTIKPMNDLVNLNRARKAKHTVAAKASAAENRVRFGRSKLVKAAEDAARLKARTSLDQVKRDPS